MKRLYGERLRKDGGLTKTLKSVAGKTLPKAGRHAPEIERVVREVQGSLEKVEEKLTGAVEDFLDHGKPGGLLSRLTFSPTTIRRNGK